jgi:hypothetical protein
MGEVFLEGRGAARDSFQDPGSEGLRIGPMMRM